MSPSQAWKRLGINSSADRREIKRAYAAKLKLVDPDSDPQAFLQLREALELALWHAEYHDSPVGEAEPEEGEGFDDTAVLSSIDDEDRVEAHHDEQRGAVDPEFQQRNRLAEILWVEEPIVPLEDEARALVRQIIEASETQRVDEAGDIEEWLAWLTANTIRRSDCIIPILVDHYGWKKKVGSIHINPAYREIIGRYEDLAYVIELRNPNHMDFAHFQRLTQARSSSPYIWERSIYGSGLRKFIARIREFHPTVEWDFNPDTVKKWGNTLTKVDGDGESVGGWRLAWLLLIFLSIIARTCDSSDDHRPVTPPQTSLENLDTFTLFARWRAEQDPSVRERMDDKKELILELIKDNEAARNLPSCDQLDVIVSLSAAEKATCLDAAEHRAQYAPLPSSSPVKSEALESTKWIYSSPSWRSEQAPRVQQWMDSHPDELSDLLRPHVGQGGLPDCSKLGAVVGMSTAEMGQCRSAQSRRLARNESRQAPLADRPSMPLPSQHTESPSNAESEESVVLWTDDPLSKDGKSKARDICQDSENTGECVIR